MEATLIHKTLALTQWVALFTLPQLLWKPHWSAYLSLIGGERAANVYGNAALTALLLLLGNSVFYVIYKLRWDFFERHKVQRNTPWPWDSPSAAPRFLTTVRQGALLAALNVALSVPLGALSYANVKALGYSGAAAAFPSAFTMAWQLALFILLEDTLFYWGHRLLHQPWALYSSIHKVHHAFTHSVCVAATATHPVEYILSNVLPFVAGPTLVGAHCATIYVWLIYRMGETMAHHSGYDFPWSMFTLLPFQGSAEEHDLHHSQNTGNYGSMFTVWDTLMRTRIEEKEE